VHNDKSYPRVTSMVTCDIVICDVSFILLPFVHFVVEKFFEHNAQAKVENSFRADMNRLWQLAGWDDVSAGEQNRAEERVDYLAQESLHSVGEIPDASTFAFHSVVEQRKSFRTFAIHPHRYTAQ